MPTSTVEDYLKCIFLVEQDSSGARVTMGQIASELGVAPGTVTAMMKTLAESELVSYEPYLGVRLSPSGATLAAHVLRRHRLIEQFLVQFMGFDWSEVHEEAELLEHYASDRLVERIDEMLGHPTVDPHGDPIPSADGNLAVLDHPNLLECELQRELRVVRVTDQNAEFLRFVEGEGLAPGSRVEVEDRSEAADRVRLNVSGREVSIGFRAASKVEVASV